MKKYLIILGVILSFLGCAKKVYIPMETKTKTEYKDSLIFIYDTTYVYLPSEEKQNQTLEDSSHLETKYAKSDAWVKDGKLNHSLENKTENPIKVIRDTIFVVQNKTELKEVPVEVPVEIPYIPSWCWWVIIYAAITTTWSIGKFIWKMKVI